MTLINSVVVIMALINSVVGIMAILFCGVVMSHYTHLNLSPVTQITTQLTFRTIAFTAGTSAMLSKNYYL